MAWVVEGQTRNFAWSATPALLMADLHRRGVLVRKPPLYMRWGVAGSGGPDWLRNRYEFIICSSCGKLPWSDNTAMGHPPVYGPGGDCTNRSANGKRRISAGRRSLDKARADGTDEIQHYRPPAIANPGNIVDCGPAGGGNMGSALCHLSEAPFPEYLAEFFIRSFCRPSGTVLDPFCGGGTTVAVSRLNGRRFIGIDIRESQVALTRRRLAATAPLLAGGGI